MQSTFADPTAAGRWEYRDLVVPLGVRHLDDRESISRCNQIIGEHLQRAAQEGWQPDEASDFLSLEREHRVRWHDEPGGEYGFRGALYDSVTIRLRRPQRP